ncbi:MAG: calcium-binding protein [Chloroflexota bacterium]
MTSYSKTNPPKIDDSVCVKDGFIDEETEHNMSGWQGRVKELYLDAGSALVMFDSITIDAIPDAYIELCEEQGYSWTEYGFGFEWLNTAKARDRTRDAAKAEKRRAVHVRYLHLGEEGRDINQILKGIPPGDIMADLQAWEEHLLQHLDFPFAATVDEMIARGPLQVGDRIKVHGIEMIDDMYGVIVKLRRGRKLFHHPLCDLAAMDESSSNHDLVQLYRVWFANR